MKRKVIQLAGKTLVVSLPSQWAKTHGVKKGDEVELEEKGDKILLNTKSSTHEPKKIRIDLTNTNIDIVKSIVAILHKKGYDEIEILYGTFDRFKIIRDTVNSMLIGYEIIDQTKNRVLIKNLILKDQTDMDSLIQRNFNIGVNMANELIIGIKGKDIQKINETMNLEATNNKLTNISQRILNQKDMDPLDKCFLYTILWNYENICDDLKNIGIIISQSNTILINNKSLAILEETKKNIDLLRKLYYTYSYNILEEFSSRCKTTVEKIHKNPKDQKIMNILFNINTTLTNLNGSITGLNYEKTLNPIL